MDGHQPAGVGSTTAEGIDSQVIGCTLDLALPFVGSFWRVGSGCCGVERALGFYGPVGAFLFDCCGVRYVLLFRNRLGA
jgi:hypothetical protein